MASTTKKPATQVATADTAPAFAAHNASLMARVAGRYGVDPDKMNGALKATAFRQRAKKDGAPPAEVTNEQMLMLMVVADQYKLNPFTREIYAFPSENGIVAIVSVDGWIRIINERPELASITFETAPPGTDDPWISCTIERKDRTKPVTVIEYLSECGRDTLPWKSHPRRMLRHKALIQCARVAFGFAGIFDPDEADRVVSIVEQPTRVGKPKTEGPRAKIEGPAPISLDQLTVITDKLKEEGVEESLFLASFNIGAVEELPADRYALALEAIDKLSADNQ